MLELDGEVISESAYIIHRLLALGPSDSVETQPSNDSIYWSHFSEASQMNLMQAGAILGATSAGFSQMVLKDDAGKEAVKSYNQWVQVGPVHIAILLKAVMVDTYIRNHTSDLRTRPTWIR